MESIKRKGMRGLLHGSTVFSVLVVSAVSLHAQGMLLPQSSYRELVQEDIRDYSTQELCYARNEIYARQGCLFSSEELMEYFGGQDWYFGWIDQEDFSDEFLSEIEQKNVQWLKEQECMLLAGGYQTDRSERHTVGGRSRENPEEERLSQALSSMATGRAEILGDRFRLDLNGDGMAEQIELTADNSYLLVNGEGIEVKENLVEPVCYGMNAHGRIYLLLHTSSGRTMSESMLFSYTDQLEMMGKVGAEPGELYLEDGKICGSITWELFPRYRMDVAWETDEEGRLRMQEQEWYDLWDYGEEPLYLTETLSLYSEPDPEAEKDIFYPQKVEWFSTDQTDWICLEGAEGETGWMYLKDYEISEIRDLFENISDVR